MTDRDPKARLAELRERLPKPSPERLAEMEEAAAAAHPALVALVRELASRNGDPYSLASDLSRQALRSYGPSGRNCTRAATLWKVWTDFDDLAYRPEWRTAELEDAIVRAASEWLSIDDREEQDWHEYQARWDVWTRTFAEEQRPSALPLRTRSGSRLRTEAEVSIPVVMAATDLPGWIGEWLSRNPDALNSDVVRELTTFGADAERLGLSPVLLGDASDPVFALRYPNDDGLVYSWEIALREYDVEIDINPLSVWLVDNIGNEAGMGPSWLRDPPDPDPSGVVRIRRHSERFET